MVVGLQKRKIRHISVTSGVEKNTDGSPFYWDLLPLITKGPEQVKNPRVIKCM